MRTAALALVLIVLGNQKLAHTADIGDEQRSAEQAIQQWIADWDKPSFSARNAASRQLRDAGRNAFPALVEAARRGTHETISRALALLKSSLYADDASLKEAARKSLDQIAADPNASAAPSARQILQEYDRPPPRLATAQAFGLPNGPMQFGFPGFGPPAANIARRINTWTRNGTTTLEAFENDVKVKIQSDVAGRIKVEITRKKQGLDVTNKFEAANARELKTKHPEAHQAYQKYEPSLQQARMLAQRGGGAPAVPPIPGMPNLPQLRGDARPQLLQIQEKQIEFLQRLIAQAPTPEVADSLNRSLQRTIESRDQLQRDLRRSR